jgi:pimeloyl-ACP methyl ester carboxylesterase
MMSARARLARSTGDGDRLAYLDSGPRRTSAIVLLHSLGADHRMWRGLVDNLAPDYRVLAPDSRGHGDSAVVGPPSIEAWVSDVDCVLNHAGVDSAVLVGLSLGGIQAIAYAADRADRVSALVVADSFVELPPEVAGAKTAALADQATAAGMTGLADSYVEDTFTGSPLPSGADDVRRAIAGMDARAYVAAVDACFGVRIADRLPRIAAPTLVVWGERDRKTPRPLSERIAREIAGAQLAVVPDAGHLSVVDNPDGFAAVTVPFILAHLNRTPKPEGAR